jgi:hypothetical protein
LNLDSFRRQYYSVNREKVGDLKKILFILLFIVLVSGVNAQEIKFIVGGSLSKYDIYPEVYFDSDRGDEYRYEISSKTGFLLGTGIEFTLARNISFEIDVLYLQKGTKVHKVYSQIEIFVFPQEYTLQVISIPVLLKIKFLRGTSPYILGGHEWSFILSHGFSSRFEGQIGDFASIKEFTETLESSLVFGGGLEMKKKSILFFIEGRYHYGLNNIIKGQPDWTSAKTSTTVLLVGFKI